jgi:hypothetical protein
MNRIRRATGFQRRQTKAGLNSAAVPASEGMAIRWAHRQGEVAFWVQEWYQDERAPQVHLATNGDAWKRPQPL